MFFFRKRKHSNDFLNSIVLIVTNFCKFEILVAYFVSTNITQKLNLERAQKCHHGKLKYPENSFLRG